MVMHALSLLSSGWRHPHCRACYTSLPLSMSYLTLVSETVVHHVNVWGQADIRTSSVSSSRWHGSQVVLCVHSSQPNLALILVQGVYAPSLWYMRNSEKVHLLSSYMPGICTYRNCYPHAPFFLFFVSLLITYLLGIDDVETLCDE